MNPNEELKLLIRSSTYLSLGDKDFLLERVPSMSPVDKIRLKSSLTNGQIPEILESLQIIRAKFFQSQAPKKPDMLSQIAQAVIKPKPKLSASVSLISQPSLLGHNPPVPFPVQNGSVLQSIDSFQSLEELSLLDNRHVYFEPGRNYQQVLGLFFSKLDSLFAKVPDIYTKRRYFMNFLNSTLFSNYINTGLTALNHHELEPKAIILNTLFQISTRHLNNQQFRITASICNHIRNLCSL